MKSYPAPFDLLPSWGLVLILIRRASGTQVFWSWDTVRTWVRRNKRQRHEGHLRNEVTGLGGNGTIIGASANVIATGLAQARGVKITFMEFAKVGIVILVLTTAVTNLILLARFWG